MNIVSWNVNGINACLRKGLLEFIEKEKADFYCFQEIKASLDKIPEKLKVLKGLHSFWFPAKKKGYSGVAVLSKKKPLAVVKGMGVEEFDDEGRVLTLEFNDFFLVNAYFPNAGDGLKRLDFKLKFNKAFQKFVEKLKKPVVIGSDFNVAHEEIDLANPKQNEGRACFTEEERSWFGRFLKDGFVDSFREFEKGGGHYSFWTYRFKSRDRNIGWRLDYFVVSEKLKRKMKNSLILKNVMGSDHCPILLKIR
ncbi:MAG: exodeoxyribonuclease III [Nanoarchaeota archaeon]|nr:exodeoxyribonuclease III [Nanoarchaeota archaeon]